MLDSYLAQMERHARRHNVDLSEACKAAKIAYTTLWRWQSKLTHPRHQEAERVMDMISRMGDGEWGFK